MIIIIRRDTKNQTCFLKSLSLMSREDTSSKIIAQGIAESLAPRNTLSGVTGSGGKALES